jgi:hypothetical protein
MIVKDPAGKVHIFHARFWKNAGSPSHTSKHEYYQTRPPQHRRIPTLGIQARQWIPYHAGKCSQTDKMPPNASQGSHFRFSIATMATKGVEIFPGPPKKRKKGPRARFVRANVFNIPDMEFVNSHFVAQHLMIRTSWAKRSSMCVKCPRISDLNGPLLLTTLTSQATPAQRSGTWFKHWFESQDSYIFICRIYYIGSYDLFP